jgi:hypothetical protein
MFTASISIHREKEDESNIKINLRQFQTEQKLLFAKQFRKNASEKRSKMND